MIDDGKEEMLDWIGLGRGNENKIPIQLALTDWGSIGWRGIFEFSNESFLIKIVWAIELNRKKDGKISLGQSRWPRQKVLKARRNKTKWEEEKSLLTAAQQPQQTFKRMCALDSIA